MSTTFTWNGVSYTIPAVNDVSWGAEVTKFLLSLPNNTITKDVGAWHLTTADLDLGSSYGLASLYVKSKTATIASAGFVRMAKTDTLGWKNNAGSGNNILSTASDILKWNTVEIPTISSTSTLTNKTINGPDNTLTNIAGTSIASDAAIAYSKLTLTDSIVNADISSAAAIAYSKLSLTGNIVNADVKSNAAIAYSKLALSNSLVNADIGSSAAIALTKLATVTASKALVSTSGGVISPSATTATELDYLSGVTSSIQAQFSGKISGPSGANANSISRFNGTTGFIAKDSGVIVDDTNTITGIKQLTSGIIKATTSIILEDPGAGTSTFTLQAPTLAGDLTLKLPTVSGTSGQYLKTDGAGNSSWSTPLGAGDVLGSASSVNHAIPRYDGVTGKVIHGCVSGDPTIDDVGQITAVKYIGKNTENWNFSSAELRRNASNTANAKMLSLLLGADDEASATVGANWALWLNHSDVIDVADVSGSTTHMTLAGPGDHITKTGGNTERMRINSSGDVGIGTSTPSARLTIQSSVDAALGGELLAAIDGNMSDASNGWSTTDWEKTFIFTVTAANATAGATYADSVTGKEFTVKTTITGTTSLTCTATVGAPSASGTLNKTSGTGDSAITFSAVAATYNHAAGTTTEGTLTGYAATATTVYQVVMTIVTTTAGTLTIGYGGASATAIGQVAGTITSYAVVLTATTTAGLTVTPDAAWAGTIDNVSLKVITVGTAAQSIKNAAGTTCAELRAKSTTSMGYGLNSMRYVSGANNTAFGANALSKVATGSENTAFGSNAGAAYCGADLTGITAIGYNALAACTRGYNTAVGYRALQAVTTSTGNVALGWSAQQTTTTGGYNISIGQQALNLVTTGSFNTAMGYLAGGSNVTGTGNICFGPYAGRYNTSSNKLYIDNTDRTNTAGDDASAIITGTMAADATTQTVKFNTKQIGISTAQTPASATATGVAGTICWDASYIYVCTATNTWKRVAIATW